MAAGSHAICISNYKAQSLAILFVGPVTLVALNVHTVRSVLHNNFRTAVVGGMTP